MPKLEVARRKAKVSGWVLGGLALLPFVGGGMYSFLSNDPAMAQGFATYGWPSAMQVPIICLELIGAVLYLAPPTSVLGAIWLTGYLGGAIATHLRIGEMNIALQVILGVMLWGGLFLRYPSLRKLIPLCRE